jgi:class 3 adenylate cyclase
VIGDAVNVAQRLLEVGHVVAPEHVTVIVTTAPASPRFAAEARPLTRSLGLHHVRGRHGMVELVEVLDGEGDRRRAMLGDLAAETTMDRGE